MSAPCLRCGDETENVVTLTGLLEGKHYACGPCFDVAFASLEENRRQFEELIAAGVPRDKANEIMIARIDGARPG
jgi:hypothetical protein